MLRDLISRFFLPWWRDPYWISTGEVGGTLYGAYTWECPIRLRGGLQIRDSGIHPVWLISWCGEKPHLLGAAFHYASGYNCGNKAFRVDTEGEGGGIFSPALLRACKRKEDAESILRGVPHWVLQDVTYFVWDHLLPPGGEMISIVEALLEGENPMHVIIYRVTSGRWYYITTPSEPPYKITKQFRYSRQERWIHLSDWDEKEIHHAPIEGCAKATARVLLTEKDIHKDLWPIALLRDEDNG